VSDYAKSSCLSVFFTDAFLRADPLRSAELAEVVLRVCDRVRRFVDRENPESDAVHKAAHVLRYVVEKRSSSRSSSLHSAGRGGMPAELFALRECAVQSGLPALAGQPTGSAARSMDQPALVGADGTARNTQQRGHELRPENPSHSSCLADLPSAVSVDGIRSSTPQRSLEHRPEALFDSPCPSSATHSPASVSFGLASASPIPNRGSASASQKAQLKSSWSKPPVSELKAAAIPQDCESSAMVVSRRITSKRCFSAAIGNTVDLSPSPPPKTPRFLRL